MSQEAKQAHQAIHLDKLKSLPHFDRPFILALTHDGGATYTRACVLMAPSVGALQERLGPLDGHESVEFPGMFGSGWLNSIYAADATYRETRRNSRIPGPMRGWDRHEVLRSNDAPTEVRYYSLPVRSLEVGVNDGDLHLMILDHIEECADSLLHLPDMEWLRDWLDSRVAEKYGYVIVGTLATPRAEALPSHSYQDAAKGLRKERAAIKEEISECAARLALLMNQQLLLQGGSDNVHAAINITFETRRDGQGRVVQVMPGKVDVLALIEA